MCIRDSYYSTYYEQCSQTEHQERFRPLADAIHGCFDGTANVQALLQHILDNMMNLAMRVYSGELTDSDEALSLIHILTAAHRLRQCTSEYIIGHFLSLLPLMQTAAPLMRWIADYRYAGRSSLALGRSLPASSAQ